MNLLTNKDENNVNPDFNYDNSQPGFREGGGPVHWLHSLDPLRLRSENKLVKYHRHHQHHHGLQFLVDVQTIIIISTLVLKI